MTYTFFCKDDVKMVYALESKGDAIMGAILINFPGRYEGCVPALGGYRPLGGVCTSPGRVQVAKRGPPGPLVPGPLPLLLPDLLPGSWSFPCHGSVQAVIHLKSTIS